MKRLFIFVMVTLFFSLLAEAAEKNKGELSNLVCFVSFSDEDDQTLFDKPITFYQTLFNNEEVGANSVFNYFREASYNQLTWKSSFFPAPVGNQITSVHVKNPRGYYSPVSSINSIGYQSELDKAAREQALVREIAAYLSENLTGIELDANDDGFIDNTCLVISGNSELSASKLLWPHRSDLLLPDEKAIYINDKKMTSYIMVFNDANGWSSFNAKTLNTGVLCHEMSHSLGTYDLYHVNDDLSPVGVWDLMSDNLTVPQHMTAYTKYKYCKWIDEIPEISTPGTYTLNPVGSSSKENLCYKIKPIGSDEYFVVEYRKKAGTFDIGLPSSGLLIYRINPNVNSGNVNYNGTTHLDEQYIFRPGGTTTADGSISLATFSAESGRTAFGSSAAVKPFYSNGEEAKVAIANITSAGETISFDLLEVAAQIYLPVTEVQLNGEAASSMQLTVQSDVAWSINDVPDWLTVMPTHGEAGTATITVQSNSSNESAQYRTGNFHLIAVSDPSITAEVTVSQRSNLIQAPTSLTANLANNQIQLSWVAPKEGSAIFSEGFETPDNHNGWMINNAGDRGWWWTASSKYHLSYSGSYLGHMKDSFYDEHQDEWLISPSFSNGKTLTFFSRSTAPQKNNAANLYYVKVSNDGGATWTNAWDLKKDCYVVNKYVRVDIDLSPYTSNNMKIAFHAYDTNNTGLSYWWDIDDIAVFPQVENSLVKKYAIYRTGTKIGESTSTTFVDTTPLTGDNVYTVRAVGDFGDTPDSEAITINYAGDGVEETFAADLSVSCNDKQLTIESAATIAQLSIYSVQGNLLLTEPLHTTVATTDIHSLSTGVYLLSVTLEESNQTVVRKLIVR